MDTPETRFIVGLDIGTTKICAVVGEVDSEGQVKVVGIGDSDSKGMRKGMVINIEDTAKSIKKAIEAAEQMAGCTIDNVYVGVAGDHIMGINSHGVIAIQGNEVARLDVQRVLEAAKAVAIPSDREVIHNLAQEYIVDGQHGIYDPVGMAGVRLEVNVHIVTGSSAAILNIIRSCNRAGVKVNEFFLESLASAEAVLTDEEKEIGVALVDLGGGTTDIAIYENNAIMHTAVIALGGTTVTNDIAFGLRTSNQSAEKIKLKHACALRDLVQRDESIEVPSVGGREPQKLSRQVLADICEPRMEEILNMVNRKLVDANCKDRIRAGVVFTGGASLIEGCEDLGEQVLDIPTRVGYPRNIRGLTDVVNNPKFATAVGLLRMGAAREAEEGRPEPVTVPTPSADPVYQGTSTEDAGEEGSFFATLMKRIRGWFKSIV